MVDSICVTGEDKAIVKSHQGFCSLRKQHIFKEHLVARGGIMTEREQSKWKEHADETYAIFDV